MKISIASLAISLATAVVVIGGVAAVLAEIDGAPGGVLLGLLLIAGAVALGMRSARRRR